MLPDGAQSDTAGAEFEARSCKFEIVSVPLEGGAHVHQSVFPSPPPARTSAGSEVEMLLSPKITPAADLIGARKAKLSLEPPKNTGTGSALVQFPRGSSARAVNAKSPGPGLAHWTENGGLVLV